MATTRTTTAMAVVGALASLALLTAGCGASTVAVAPTTTPPTVAPTTTVQPGPTTTAAFAPVTPEPSASAAIARLLATWANHDRVSAGYVATPAAVAALFAVPAVPLQSRGCSTDAPVTCSYADRSANGNFYDIEAVQASGGSWYVDQVQVTPIG